jgi:hypothetical protein
MFFDKSQAMSLNYFQNVRVSIMGRNTKVKSAKENLMKFTDYIYVTAATN